MSETARGSSAQRMLFLDDDPKRANLLQATHPEAIWVQTASECLEMLREPWDEVHLDHDLGGEVFVDTAREDCGMEVVRWLCAEPRPHLQATRFYIHTHNMNASCTMLLQLEMAGYWVRLRPFSGAGGAPPQLKSAPGWRRVAQRIVGWLRPLLDPGPRY